MVENAIAIIATCLPALRSMVLGTNTSKANSSSYGKHYELSSARRKANENRLTSNHVNGLPSTHSTHDTRHRANGSEDSLFSDGPLEQSGVDNPVGKITVNTQIETMFEDTSKRSELSRAKSPF
jgi:hypothetical protein